MEHVVTEAYRNAANTMGVRPETDEITLMGLAETIDAKIDEIHHLIDRLAPALHGRFESGSAEKGEGMPQPRVATYNRLNRADDKLTHALSRLQDLINVVGA